MGEESRAVERIRLFYYIEILELGTGRPVGRVGDISPQGLMIMTHRPFQLNRILRVELRIPTIEPFDGGFLPLEIEPKWSSQGEHPNQRCIGCSIRSYPFEARDTIRKLIEFYGMKEKGAESPSREIKRSEHSRPVGKNRLDPL